MIFWVITLYTCHLLISQTGNFSLKWEYTEQSFYVFERHHPADDNFQRYKLFGQ